MTQRVTFEQHPGECENIGSGTALIFSGHIDNAVPRMTSLDIGSNHSWQRMQYLNERRNDLRNSVANGSQEYALYIGFWGYFALSLLLNLKGSISDIRIITIIKSKKRLLIISFAFFADDAFQTLGA